jgi:hypothetical protein
VGQGDSADPDSGHQTTLTSARSEPKAGQPGPAAGVRDHLAYAITNLDQALLEMGQWDAAESELTQAVDSDGLAEHEQLAAIRAWLQALRGDGTSAATILAGLRDLRASEDPQARATLSVTEAFTAAARRQPQDVLRHARATIVLADAIGMNHEALRGGWPLAARAAHELGDRAATRDLLALLDSYPIGHLAPMLRAERDLVSARLADLDGDQSAEAAFVTAVGSLRGLSTPYHLAHGLLDHAEYLMRQGDAGTATAAIEEARSIAEGLRCQPLLDRAEDLTPAAPRIPA